MNKVVLTDVIESLSQAANTSEALCASFLRDFFALISEGLMTEESVDIANIGTFRVENGNVSYVPDQGIALALNSAFDCFEPVALDDDVTDEILLSDSSVLATCAEEKAILENASESIDEQVGEHQSVKEEPLPILVIDEEGSVSQQMDTDKAMEDLSNDSVEDIDDNVSDVPNDIDDNMVCSQQVAIYPFWRKAVIFLSGIIIGSVGCVLSFLLFFGKMESEPVAIGELAADTAKVIEQKHKVSKNVVAVKDVESDTIIKKKSDVETVSPIYYKVEKTSYLSNISRKYYGHYAFWVYIYMENKAKIKNPDNLPIGLVLVIPPAEKYGIDKNNPESIYKAEKLAVELFGKGS